MNAVTPTDHYITPTEAVVIERLLYLEMNAFEPPPRMLFVCVAVVCRRFRPDECG
jgi:hypothetical protein